MSKSRRTIKLRVGDIVVATANHAESCTKGKKYTVTGIDSYKDQEDQIWINCDDGSNRHGGRSLFLKAISNLNKHTKVI